MTTFSKSTFNAVKYSSFRPTYPGKLFDHIFDYHSTEKHAKWDFAVDLGCGTGQATRRLSKFNKILGIDPSGPMVQACLEENARQANAKSTLSAQRRINFVQGNAEDLNGILADNSVDMLISAQSSHWFVWDKVWPEAKRVLRSGGTAAFWIYAEFRLRDYPSVSPMITAFAQGTDPKTSLGPHFERPGRTMLENLLRDVPDPMIAYPGAFSDFQRVYYTGRDYPEIPVSQTKPMIMEKEMRWKDLLGYFRTWSPLYTYHSHFPEDMDRVDLRFPEDLKPGVEASGDDVDVSGGDIAIRFWKDLRECVKSQGGKSGVNDVIVIEWPIALLLARR